VFAPFASTAFTQYKGVAPADEPSGIIRRDFNWTVGANLEMPLTETASLGMQVQYNNNDSNLDRFTYENLQFLFGPVGRF
jgi:hypothetical protein